MKFLTAPHVVQIHDSIIGKHELQGLAKDKSIEAVIARINNRMTYAMINDSYELAACYGTYIAVGHVFNDANERTAFVSMDTCLILNGIELSYETVETGDTMIKVSQDIMDEAELVLWLRKLGCKV